MHESNGKEILLWLIRKRRRYRVKGDSMLPLLRADDEVLVNQNAYRHQSPQMGDIGTCIDRVTDAGYRMVEHFVLPVAAWWDDYYKPMEARLASLRVEFEADAPALAILEEHQREIDYFRRWSDHYGYLFVIGERAD